jgi:RNA polymerase sigma-70 factor, ECF subfamily
MNPHPQSAPISGVPPAPQAQVRGIHAARSDAEIVEGLQRGEPWARAALFDRYSADVQRVLAWVLGVDSELPDLLHDVFLRAFDGVRELADPSRLRAWLVSVAVYAARERIRKRKRRAWLLTWLGRDAACPSPLPGCSTPAERELVASTRAVLERLTTDERITLTLRHMAGLRLEELADACGVSLATVKRRLSGAREKFESMARNDPVLLEWLEGAGDD